MGIVRISLAVLSMLSLAICALVEILLAVPLPIQMYMGLWVVCTVVSAIFILLRQPLQQRLLAMGAYLAISLALATVYFVPWTSRKPFLRDLGRIKVGMTEAEVKQIMSDHGQGTGYPATPGQKGLIYDGGRFETVATANGEIAFKDSLAFHHSKSSRFNCDWGVVRFKDGRVTKVVFLPD